MKRGWMVIGLVAVGALAGAAALPARGMPATASGARHAMAAPQPLSEAAMVAQKHGVNYAELVRLAGKGDVKTLRRLMRMSKWMDAAAADDHASTLASLLRQVGDRKFALAVGQESASVREMVRQLLMYDTGMSSYGVSRWYPRTAVASGLMMPR